MLRLRESVPYQSALTRRAPIPIAMF